jgi:hypothetical protein
MYLFEFDRHRQRRSQKPVYYLDPAPGGGKTKAAAAHIIHSIGITPPEIKVGPGLGVTVQMAAKRAWVPETTSHLVSFPHRGVLNQFETDLRKLGAKDDDILKITTDTHPGEVGATLMSALKTWGDKNKIILCCHESLFQLSYLHDRGWRVWVDEIPQLTASYAPMLPRRGDLLSEHLTIEDDEKGRTRVIARNHGKLKRP